MAVTLEEYGLDRLPANERLELLSLLWDSLEEGTWTLPEWHIRELEKRAEAEADPSAGIPWEQFKTDWLGQS